MISRFCNKSLYSCSALKYRHGLFVNTLAQSALLLSKLRKSFLALLVVMGLKIEIRSRLAKVCPVFLNPWVLLLHSCNIPTSFLVLLFQKLDLVIDTLLFEFLLLCHTFVIRQLLRECAQAFVQLS